MAATELKNRTVPIEWEPLNNDGKHKSSEEIEHDIENTRHVMDSTMDEMGSKLHPRHIVDEIFDFFSSRGTESRATLSDTGKQIARLISDNPLPSLLIGAGVGILLINQYAGEKVRNVSGDGKAGAVDSSKEKGASVVDTLKEKGAQLKDTLQEKFGSAKESGGTAAGNLQEKMSDVSGQFGERSRMMRENVRGQFFAGRDQVSNVIRDNPIGVGIAALAIGVIAGLIFPATRAERETVGETSHDIQQKTAEKVQGMAQEGSEKIKNVVQGKSGEATPTQPVVNPVPTSIEPPPGQPLAP